MKTTKLLFTLVFSVITFIGIASNGNSDKTETRQVSNFNGIKVSTGIDLYITMGASEEVKIVANDEIIDEPKPAVVATLKHRIWKVQFAR